MAGYDVDIQDVGNATESGKVVTDGSVRLANGPKKGNTRVKNVLNAKEGVHIQGDLEIGNSYPQAPAPTVKNYTKNEYKVDKAEGSMIGGSNNTMTNTTAPKVKAEAKQSKIKILVKGLGDDPLRVFLNEDKNTVGDLRKKIKDQKSTDRDIDTAIFKVEDELAGKVMIQDDDKLSNGTVFVEFKRTKITVGVVYHRNGKKEVVHLEPTKNLLSDLINKIQVNDGDQFKTIDGVSLPLDHPLCHEETVNVYPKETQKDDKITSIYS